MLSPSALQFRHYGPFPKTRIPKKQRFFFFFFFFNFNQLKTPEPLT